MLRWVLFVPVALLATYVVSFVYDFLVSALGVPNGMVRYGIESLVLGTCFVYLGTLVAPSNQYTVAIVLSVVVALVSPLLVIIFSMTGGKFAGVTNPQYSALVWQFVLYGALMLVGGLAVALLGFKKS
jgi:hypothetical protein